MLNLASAEQAIEQAGVSAMVATDATGGVEYVQLRLPGGHSAGRQWRVYAGSSTTVRELAEDLITLGAKLARR